MTSAALAAQRPEAELLLRCAQISENSSSAEQIRGLLRKDIDWVYLLRLASGHRMLQLLYWHLNNIYPEAVPKASLDELQKRFYENSYHILLLIGELLKLLNLFEAGDIHTIPYKGPALAAFLYGNLSLREFDDLDILVHAKDVPRAKELLVSVGYRPEYDLNSTQEGVALRHDYELRFISGDGRSEIDLHWGIAERHFSFPLEPGSLWERLQPVPLGADTVLTLSPEDLLLLLCVHGSKHLWKRLRWICDVAQLIHVHEGMDWKWVMRQARSLGSERMLYLGLYLASDLLGAALPQDVSRRVEADPTVKALARRVSAELLSEANTVPTISEDFPLHLFHIRVRERLRDKVSYCVRAVTATTVRDWSLLPLPRYLYPLYFVIRPLRLILKYGSRLLERLSYNKEDAR
jgi:Uncharacterised nucleotidyltransferase